MKECFSFRKQWTSFRQHSSKFHSSRRQVDDYSFRTVSNVTFLSSLMAIGLERFSKKWDLVSKRFLPTKTEKQVSAAWIDETFRSIDISLAVKNSLQESLLGSIRRKFGKRVENHGQSIANQYVHELPRVSAPWDSHFVDTCYSATELDVDLSTASVARMFNGPAPEWFVVRARSRLVQAVALLCRA